MKYQLTLIVQFDKAPKKLEQNLRGVLKKHGLNSSECAQIDISEMVEY